MGYTNTGSGWISVKDGTSISFTESSTAASTYDKDNSALQSAGYIDATGNLVAAHDVAHVHWGGEWRMPTRDEIDALINNCTTTWITTNGVPGRLVKGKGEYADRSIFLPAGGYGNDSSLFYPGLDGYYWSSTPYSVNSGFTWNLLFYSSYFRRINNRRFYGLSVRPVRGFVGAVGIVTYDPSETQTTEVFVPYAWLRAHDPTVADECEAYEAAARRTAANGWKVWECYALGLDPQVATSDFRIASFPMKAGGTPNWTNVKFDPPREQWNVPNAPVTWKGAAQLEGPWRTVTADGGLPGTVCSTMQFFKAVVFGDAGNMVQLWEGGPYWATTNIGAEDPWKYGYYFWWGDMVGYTRSGGTWTSYDYSDVTWVSSTGEQMSSSPFSYLSCPTYHKDNSALLSAGYIDSTGNLAPEHDAARVHWGGEWRMPTDAEFSALVSNCTTTWISTNGVYGRLVTGKDSYANRSIFLPAAGDGSVSYLFGPGLDGCYWSSTPDSGNAWYLLFNSGYFSRFSDLRYHGRSVRPVRGFTP